MGERLKEKIMTQNKKFGLIFTIISFIPLKAEAFWNFCFPVSYVIWTFILGWPSPVIYELLPKHLSKPILGEGFTRMFILGFVIDLIIILVIGFIVDKRKGIQSVSVREKYIFKLPSYFILTVLILFLLSFVDPTCW